MLQVHRSERADCLVDALGAVLADPLPDPVAPEIVAVPTRGVERWLSQRLSHVLGAGPGGDGVCANLSFPFPSRLLTQATAAATGVGSDEDPWIAERCVWPLVDLIDEHSADPVMAPLRDHLRDATPADRPVRRLALARHLAELYERYGMYRPEMLLSWIPGDRPSPCSPVEAWQAHLWRKLRDRIDAPSPAERLEQAVDRLASAPGAVDLPSRLSVFGLTRLPSSQLDILAAIGAGRDVHLFLLHPSAALWDRVTALDSPPPMTARSADPTSRLAAHPLLRSWARDSREMQLVLASRSVTSGCHHPVPDNDGGPDRPGRRMLATIQAEVRADRAPGSAPRLAIDTSDRSLRVFSCHGRARQVEVARDAILHLLQSDRSLEPRDVVVMCPDIDDFAPLIHATFGVAPSGADGLPELRVRLADRSIRQTNPLLSVAAQLLDLAASRVTASAVLDLAGRPPVCARFRFDREELSTVEQWIAGTGIRWGLDGGHRRAWALQDVEDNSWAAGLDRLLLGVAMADEDCRAFAGVVPFDDVPSTSIDLAGRFAEFVRRLGLAIDRMSSRQPATSWVEAILAGVDSLAECALGDQWQIDELHQTLGSLTPEPGRQPGPFLVLDEVRSLLAAELRGRPTRANFRTGDLTICTLVPMRSVPHRVVVLVGLDDGCFPRHPERDGDDLLLQEPRIGEPDSRSEDRQLLLDALLAATEHLVITYAGRDERTNRPRPPCAPLAELLDVIDATFEGEGGRPARDHVLIAHPLQAFDARNFQAGALDAGGPEIAGLDIGRLGVEGPWSFDRISFAGARSAAAQTNGRPWLSGPLPAVPQGIVQLEDLVSFVQHPVRAFLRHRLNLYLYDGDDRLGDAMPIELDPLEKWAIGDRLLEAVVGGVELEQALEAERRRGFLPPGRLADAVIAELGTEVADLQRAFLAALEGRTAPAMSVEVRVEMPDGRMVVGAAPGVRDLSITQCNYSKLGAKHRLAAWVRYLAVNSDPTSGPVGAVTVGRGARRGAVSVARLDPPAEPAGRHLWAQQRLVTILDIYDRGMREPLPLPCRTAAAWAQSRNRGEGDDQLQARVAAEWLSNDRFPGEQEDPDHVEVWGSYAPVDALLGPPGPGEGGAGWPPEERTRLGLLARRLWDPLLGHERLETR